MLLLVSHICNDLVIKLADMRLLVKNLKPASLLCCGLNVPVSILVHNSIFRMTILHDSALCQPDTSLRGQSSQSQHHFDCFLE